MKLVIFGSTGSIGHHLVVQALEQEHTVTAFARNPAKLEIEHANLTAVRLWTDKLRCCARSGRGRRGQLDQRERGLLFGRWRRLASVGLFACQPLGSGAVGPI
jgi:nucleoside-diphosphate-sugar epimerase